MASITITISDIESAYVPEDLEEGEFAQALANIAGIIESAIENAFGTEPVMHGGIDVSVDEEL